MKKTVSLIIFMVFAVVCTTVVFAEESAKMSNHMMQKKMMMHGMGMCPMHIMMMKKELVPTQDGGVVIMMGNKLFKYDKDLKFVKEAEVKMDMDGMQKTIEGIKEKCPMCHEMSERSEIKNEMKGAEEDAAAKTARK